jgi:hypothetical protein
MIEIERPLPLPNLHQLDLSEIAIRSNGDTGFIAYFDFKDAYSLDCQKVSEGLSPLTAKQSPST